MSEVVRLESANQMLRENFLRWQCRVRQITMREHEGKPDEAVMPSVRLQGNEEPLGHIVTVMCKRPEYSQTPELRHMIRRTEDVSQRRKSALTLFSETYYQKATEFSDVLTSTFLPGSEGAAALVRAGHCDLLFNAYQQEYHLSCKIWRLSQHNPLWQATYFHNMLFNPALPPDTTILGFEPDWARCSADPSPF